MAMIDTERRARSGIEQTARDGGKGRRCAASASAGGRADRAEGRDERSRNSWNNLERSTAVYRKAGQIEGKINHVARLRSRADDIEAMLMLLNEEPDEEMADECGAELTQLTADADALGLETMMRGEYDSCNAVRQPPRGRGRARGSAGHGLPCCTGCTPATANATASK